MIENCHHDKIVELNRKERNIEEVIDQMNEKHT